MQSEESTTSSFRDDLLRRIGRNVVNFQYLESVLRELIPSLSLQTTLSSGQTQKSIENHKIKKSSLGKLADPFLANVFDTSSVDDDISIETVNEPVIKTHFRIELDPQEIVVRKAGLRKLVTERNRLVHRDALNVDLNSAEECEQLSNTLDEQNDRIRENLKFLINLRKVQRELYSELATYMQSDEFVSSFFSAGQSDNNDKEYQ